MVCYQFVLVYNYQFWTLFKIFLYIFNAFRLTIFKLFLKMMLSSWSCYFAVVFSQVCILQMICSWVEINDCMSLNCNVKMILTCTLSPSRHIWGGSTMLRSTPTTKDLSVYCTEPIPPVAPVTWWVWIGSWRVFRQRNTVNVTSPFKMSKSQVITELFWGTWIST